VDSLERQVIVHAQQLRALGESTERVRNELARLGTKGGTSTLTTAPESPTGVSVLHPEAPNFLKPKAKAWPEPGAATDGILARGWPSGDPKGFNILIENSADVSDLANYIVGSLASRNRWTNPDEWYGDIAWRAEITDDFKEYTFYLRKGIKWHPVSGVDLNGKHRWLNTEHELTAHDFVFALDMTLNPQVENGFAKNYYQGIASYEAKDDTTLIVRWKEKTYQSLEITLGLSPIPKFLYAFAEDGTPHPPETLGLRFNQHWYNNKGMVGTGPYRFERYEPGVKIVLARNEQYLLDQPAIKQLNFPIYTDSKQTVLKLKSAEIAFGNLLPGQYREEVLALANRSNAPSDTNPFANGKITCAPIDYPAYSYIGWNADKPLFADAKVRTAMTLALNREELLQKVFVGLGTLAHGPELPQTGKNDPDVDPLKFDLERARSLLSEAGWSDTDADGLVDKVINGRKTNFEFSFLIHNSSPEFASVANVYKEDLLKIGVLLNIETADWSLMQKRMDEKQFDAYTGGWAMGWNSDPYQIWHSSQADVPKGSNKVGFRNPNADKLIEQLRVTFEPDERIRLFRALHREIYAAQPYTFFRVVKLPYCWANSVRDIVFAKARPIADSLPWSVAVHP
jgi:ABC-type transport system substrate-binding protein